MNLREHIAMIDGFKEGLTFIDITTLMENGEVFRYACDQMITFAKNKEVDVVVGPESRGFIFGCPVAYSLKVGFVPVRKPGKLPRETISIEYDLEYGSNELHIHKDSIKPGQKVLIVDDLLATGGTVDATIKLVQQLGAEVVGCAFLVELADLNGRELIRDYDVLSLTSFSRI